MSKVERAIIMAAGKGERMKPLTNKTPKPLIKVNGVPMIETIITALINNGIKEIYVVIGYLKESFSYLCEKYDDLHLIQNPYYNTCNNISSLYVARDYISNSIILDGDQVVYNKDILNPHFKLSGYNAIYTDCHTDEWLMTTNENGIVTSCSRIGGKCGWQLFSISRWNNNDAMKLKNFIELEFETNKNTNIYWDDVALFLHKDEFELGVYKMQRGDIIEIDNYNELLKIDSSYSANNKQYNKIINT